MPRRSESNSMFAESRRSDSENEQNTTAISSSPISRYKSQMKKRHKKQKTELHPPQRIYKNYSKEQKEYAINRVLKGETSIQVANSLNLPIKNLKRWLEVGSERKSGGGRKLLDPDME